MPTKPTDNVPEWAANANFAVGPSGIVGTPTRNATSLAGAVANGFVPWLPESPATGQHTNEWMHRGWALLDWVYQGSATASADAHVVETDSAGRTEWTAAPGGAGVATIEATVTGSGGTAIQGSAVNGVSIRASNDSATLAALVATNADATAGAVSCLASAIGAGDGVRTDVFDSARGFVAALDVGSLAAARGFYCDVGAVEGTAIEVRTGNNSGTGIRIEGVAGGGYGLDCEAISAIGTLARFRHVSNGTAVRIEAPSGSATCLSVDGSGSSAAATIDVVGNGASGPALTAYNFVSSSSLGDAIQRATMSVSAGVSSGGRCIAVYALADDSPATLGVGVYGSSTGTGQDSAGVYADGSAGDGHGLFAISSTQRSQLRLQPIVADAPINGRVGDVAAVDPSSSALNEGLVTYADGAWNRVAHTARRYREPAVGFDLSGGPIAEGATTGVLAGATFTAADGGDVLVRVMVGLSIAGGSGYALVSVRSDNGAGGSITTHLSNQAVRLLAFSVDGRSGVDTQSVMFCWQRKITPTNTGARRYYVEIENLTVASGVTTLYYWNPQVVVEGELTP